MEPTRASAGTSSRITNPMPRPAGPSVGMSMGYGSKSVSAADHAPPSAPQAARGAKSRGKTMALGVVMALLVAGFAVAVGIPFVRRTKGAVQPGRMLAASPYRDFQTPTTKAKRGAATPLSAKVQSLKMGGDAASETALQRAAECRYRSPVFVHTLKEEQSLGEVAGIYGVRVRDLLHLNPELGSGRNVAVGTPVRVCPELPPRRQEIVFHDVTSSDTWARLAARYEVREAELRRANPTAEGLDGPAPEPGQRLAVPRRGRIIPGFPTGEGSEHEGTLHNGVRLPNSPHYVLKRPNLNFASPQTIATVRHMAASYSDATKGHVLLFGDLSREGGGPLVGHRSHQQGRDIDIGIPLRVGERKDRFVTANGQNLHHERAWALVKQLLAEPNLAFIFVDMSVQAELYNYALREGESEAFLREVFQYPRPAKDRYGVIRHFRGHVDHFHVRFRE